MVLNLEVFLLKLPSRGLSGYVQFVSAVSEHIITEQNVEDPGTHNEKTCNITTTSSKSFSPAVHLEQEEVEASDQNGIFYYKGQAVECHQNDCASSHFGPSLQSVTCGQRCLANTRILKCITCCLPL